MLETKENQDEKVVLTAEEIMDLGIRLQAINEILSKVEVTDEIVKLLQREISDISALLICVNDSDSLEYLKKQ